MPNQPRAIKADRQNRHAAPQKKPLPAFHLDSHTPPSLLETQHQSGSSRPTQNIIGNQLPVIRTTENYPLLGFLRKQCLPEELAFSLRVESPDFSFSHGPCCTLSSCRSCAGP